jgi:hypothetical protein
MDICGVRIIIECTHTVLNLYSSRQQHLAYSDKGFCVDN